MLAPLCSPMAHAKGWTRFADVDIAPGVRILTNAGYRGDFAAEYETSGDGALGSKQILEALIAALQPGGGGAVLLQMSSFCMA